MIKEKDLTNAEQNVKEYLQDGLLTKNNSHSEFVPFYIKNAQMSLQIAQYLHKLSTDKEYKKSANFTEDFECYLWVVVTSYYSMFYTANALLAKTGLKVGEKFAHRITEDCLLFYFIKNNKLAKNLLETYKETKNEVLNLMNLNEEQLLKEFQLKAQELIATFHYQRNKRGQFKYEITSNAKQHIAQLSIDRAKNFIQEINKTI